MMVFATACANRAGKRIALGNALSFAADSPLKLTADI